MSAKNLPPTFFTLSGGLLCTFNYLAAIFFKTKKVVVGRMFEDYAEQNTPFFCPFCDGTFDGTVTAPFYLPF